MEYEDLKLKDLCILVNEGDKVAIFKITNEFENLIIKNSFVNRQFNEDCYQEQMVRLIKCAQNFKYEDKDYSKYIKKYLKII